MLEFGKTDSRAPRYQWLTENSIEHSLVAEIAFIDENRHRGYVWHNYWAEMSDVDAVKLRLTFPDEIFMLDGEGKLIPA